MSLRSSGLEWDLPAYDIQGNQLEVSGEENRYTYNGKEHLDDFGLSLSDYGARYYDAAIARWTSVDPLAEKFDSWSPYNYVVGNPIILSDPNGMDTLNMHRGSLNTELSDELTNVWNVTFSITKNGVTTPLELGDGTSEIYMFGSKEDDDIGENSLPNDTYTLNFEEMPSHPEFENTIRVTDFGVFIHKGNDLTAFGGCKGVCKTFDKDGKEWDGQSTFFGNNTQETLNSIRSLYDKHESNLTGSKFLLRNSSTAPQSSRNGSVTKQQAIKLLNQAGGVEND